MDEEDGISIRPMRLKVLYTFDDKTNCLARWPHVLDIQTAYLDEETPIGVIELKTCIQAIVSASPELVANLGRDYTVYAYDFSEYETPLVGQGMLSWVLASASPTPNAPAHQSKTIVTGRVCKNALGGLFSRSAQETLEVKLRLVPVPTALQSEYLDSMQKYRELSNVIPHDFDSQAWTNFLHANPGLLGNDNSNYTSQQAAEQETFQVDRSGIERLQQLLSESSTPRDFSNPPPPESMHADSPGTYMSRAPSRTSTPGMTRPTAQQQKRGSEEAFRPTSRGSAQSLSLGTRQQTGRGSGRRDSVMSGYGSGDERPDGPAQKRVKLVQPGSAEKPNTNIERQSGKRQPGSLRVAASTAASVRIHRPTPLNPGAPHQPAGEEPVRPPTPIPSDLPAPAPAHRGRASQGSSLRRQPTANSQFSNFSEDIAPDDNQAAVTSPEDVRGGNVADTPFNMPSSPPMMHSSYPPQTSSPILPPMPDHDSGFMSGHLDSMLDDENCNPEGKDDSAESQKRVSIAPKQSAISASGERPASSGQHDRSQNFMSDNVVVGGSSREAAPGLPPQPTSANGSRTSSRASFRRPSKPLAPSRSSQGAGGAANPGRGQAHSAGPVVPASDPVHQPNASHSQSQSMDAPASELASATPAPTRSDDSKARSGGSIYGGRKNVQAKLDQCIKDGTVPPYCENCGTIETTTWRRAWSKVLEGDANTANSHLNDPGALFWEIVDTDENEVVTSFRLYKKSVLSDDKDFNMKLLCNPCGLWLNKSKSMRPKDKWNKAPPKDKRKRKSRRMRLLEVPGAATRSNARRLAMKGTESSPGPAEGSSQAEDEESPEAETGPEETGTEKAADNAETGEGTDNGARRANSAEPPTSAQKNTQWTDAGAMGALKRAIQSSPARNFDSRHTQLSESQLTPKPVRRNLFGSASKSKDEDALRTLGDAFINGMSHTPKSTPTKQGYPPPEKENSNPAASNNSQDEPVSAVDGTNDAVDFPGSPTPKRRSPRRLQSNKSPTEKGYGVPSPSPAGQQNKQPQLPREKSSGLSASASRVNSNSKSTRSKPPSMSLQKDQHIETVDGLILNIFDSEDETGTQRSPSLFTPSKWPTTTDSWADWMTSGHISPLRTSSGQTRPDSGVSGSSADQFNKELTSPSFLQGEIDDESLHQLFGGDPAEALGSDMFNPGLVDPQLLDVWPKGADGEQGIGELDDAALAAIMQEVNGDPNS